jgi:hypothetical protein
MKLLLTVLLFALAALVLPSCVTDARLGSAVSDALGSDPVPTTVSGCNLDIAQATVDIEKLQAELEKIEADTSMAEDDKADSRKALQAQINYLEMRIVRDRAIIVSLTPVAE